MPPSPPPKKNHPHPPCDEKKYAGIKQEDLREVGSISPECTGMKKKYDDCFMDWYANEFLQGKSKPDMVPCEDLFKDYTKCVKRAIKRLDIPIETAT